MAASGEEGFHDGTRLQQKKSGFGAPGIPGCFLPPGWFRSWRSPSWPLTGLDLHLNRVSPALGCQT